MSNVLMADFLTIPSLLELDSEAAPSCYDIVDNSNDDNEAPFIIFTTSNGHGQLDELPNKKIYN